MIQSLKTMKAYHTMKTEITVENANEITKKQFVRAENAHGQAKAWCTVHQLCKDLGMYDDDMGDECSGIERVVNFITKHVNK